MAFKMKGWAPKGPLTYRGGGEATNMPTTNPAVNNENSRRQKTKLERVRKLWNDPNYHSRAYKSKYENDPNINPNLKPDYPTDEAIKAWENLNDDVNITGMKVEKGQQALSLDHDDIHNLQVAVQRGGLDKATRDAYVAAINRGPGQPMVVDPESGELNFQTNTGGIVTQPGSSDAMNNLLTTLNKGRGSQKYPDIDEEKIKKDDRKKLMRDVSREARKFEIGGADETNRLKNIPEEKEEEEVITTFKPRKKDPASLSVNNKGGKTLSQKRAAAVNQKKLSSYSKAWESNKGGVQSKYKNKAEFVKAAEDWWAKKGLDK